MTRRSTRLRILVSRETLLGLALVLLASAVCVALGLWQYGRFEGKRDEANVVEANYEAAPVAIDHVLPTPDAPLPEEQDWTPVEVHGSYCADPQCVLYVRNRQLSGHVGFWQLVPFHTDDGASLLVVRGWVASQEEDSAPADPPQVPEGERTLTVRLRPAEETLDREIPVGQVHSVNPPQIEEILPADESVLVTQAYGELAAEDPAAPRSHALPAPDTSLGPHLSYAFQWWVFALFFPAALIFRTYRTFQDLEHEEAEGAASDGGDDGDTHDTTNHRPRPKARTRRRSQDEEEEDALIDQQTR